MFLTNIQGSPSLELVYLVLDKKARGEEVVSLAIGDPSFNTPKEIVDVACQAMRAGDVHYVGSYGTLEVREAIKNKVRRKNGINAELENCIFLTTKLAVYASLMSVSETPFDALIPDPGYFYSESVILAGGTPIRYALNPDFSLNIDAIKQRITPKTKALVINTPSNPTGKVLRSGELSELYNLCKERGIFVITDEAYEDLVYEGTHFSIGSLEPKPDIVVSIFSFSKSYSMTGWRAGYVVAGPKVIPLINKLLEHTMSCFSPFIEKACSYALNNCESSILEFRREYKERRDLLTEKINEIPELEAAPIEGAFYAFPKFKSNTNSMDFAKKLLLKQNAAVLPGIVFGPRGENHMRLSFSGSNEDIEEGMKRIQRFFGEQ